MTVPEFLQPWLVPGAAAVLLLALAAVAVWLLLGRGPRRARAFRRAQRFLQKGAWGDALDVVRTLQSWGRHSATWEGRLRNAEGEAHHVGGDQALQQQRYEQSLEHYQTAAMLLNLDAAALRERVVETMLAEARRLFAAGGDNQAVPDLLARILLLHSPCPEASFWLGLAQLRAGQVDLALTSLTAAQEGAAGRFLDPPLYLGGLLLREGRAPEALRYLSEANRADSSCPLVTWQLGMALVAAGGDGRVAVQALHKALGPRGLGLWTGKDGGQRLWVEAFPETRSYVRRLALKHAFVCPLFGGDVAAMVRQGQFALAQAHYRLGNFQESADLFTKLLQDSPPSAPLLRGLGLALARLEKYDQAYKHLRIALEQDPRHPLTAGYLALCGALGKPTQDDDKPKNVAWAIRLLARFPITGDIEWARICSAVFAEARALDMAVAVEDQVRLCDVLASVHAADPAAAAAYHQLAATSFEAVRPAFAWLWCRAAQQHGCAGERDLDLFALAFRDEATARAYFAERGWDLDEVEWTYLERSAARRPGRFPEDFGPDYPARAEARLLERSRRLEAAGQKDAALAAAEVLLQLAPASPAAHDRLAYLHYQRGDRERSAALLAGWHRLEPANPWPLVRRAVVEQQRGNAAGRRQAVAQALAVTGGRTRAAVAFLGARLALQPAFAEAPKEAHGEPGANGASPGPQPSPWHEAAHLLEVCLRDDADHTEALWQLAAVRAILGDDQALAKQAAAVDRPGFTDPRFLYFAAVCHLAAGNAERALDLARRAAEDANLAADSHYLMGWVYLHLDDQPAAAAAFRSAAEAPGCAAADHARALLGRVCFARGAIDEAVTWWQAVSEGPRQRWQLDEPLRATVFLAGLRAFEDARFEQAAERFREAGKLGLRDRRLGPLLGLALLKAGQHLLYAAELAPLVSEEG